MRKIIAASAVGLAVLVLSTSGWSQTSQTLKIGVISIQDAIIQSNDGQEAARMLGTRFAPKRAELEKQQKEIDDLQQQLRNQEKTLSEEARTRLLRTLDEKTRAFSRTNEDATSEYQQAQQDAINEIGRKMMNVIGDYSKKNGYSLVLDVSSPQTPVLHWDPSTDVTQEILKLYNQATAKTSSVGTPSTPADQPPASSTAPATKPTGSTP